MSYEITGPSDSNEDLLPSRFRRENTDRFAPYIQAVVRGHAEVGMAVVKVPMVAFPKISKPRSLTDRIRDTVLAITRGIQFYPEIDADFLKKVWPFYVVEFDTAEGCAVIKPEKEFKVLFQDNVVEVNLRTGDPNFEERLAAFATLFSSYDLKGKVTILGMFDDELKQKFRERFPTRLFERDKNNEHFMS